MKKFLVAFYGLFLVTGLYSQTCDIALTGYTPPPSGEGLHTFTINWTNTENCGCNEFTQWDGNDCENSTSTHVNNNESITHIVFGIHYVNEETGEDYGENTECTSTTFHPGWSFVLSVPTTPGGFQSGSSSTFAVNPPFAWECILENPIEGYCWEVVIWQINLSQTATTLDFGDDGWSSGAGWIDGTQTYPDIDLSDNVISFCPDPIITDTVYVYDTVYVETIDTLVITEFLTDTIYLTEIEYLTDTLYITEYITDTLFLTQIDSVFIDNYIYFTDTITEYIVQELWIDCETGLPCDEEPPGIQCPDWATLFIPNTFTPNNDGFNDAWKVEYDSDCWEYVEFEIFNRWGGRVFYGDTFWDGSVNGGSYYVADGVYTYIVKAKRYDRPNIIQKSGHITVFR
jgi:gliding motility-associated-like protein